MTNIFGSPEKHDRKKQLFRIGLETLEKDGWVVAKPRMGKSSVRRITKAGENKLISIRTTQDRWLAFPPNDNGKGWITLDDVDLVLAVSVSPSSDEEAWAHLVPASEMRKHYDAAYKARKAAGRVFPKRRGVWIPLYEREADNPENVGYVGGGIGLDHPPMARVPLNDDGPTPPRKGDAERKEGGRFSIADAKRELAQSLGVAESSIKITVEA